MGASFCTGVLPIDGIALSVDYVVVDAVFDIGLALRVPNIRWLFVSFSVKSSGTSPSQYRYRSPMRACDAATAWEPLPAVACFNVGLGVPGHHVQMLRNHRVGSTCNVAGSGPRLHTLIWMRMSSGVCLAYSTKTSK